MLIKFDGSTKNFFGTTSLEWTGLCRESAPLTSSAQIKIKVVDDDIFQDFLQFAGTVRRVWVRWLIYSKVVEKFRIVQEYLVGAHKSKDDVTTFRKRPRVRMCLYVTVT